MDRTPRLWFRCASLALVVVVLVFGTSAQAQDPAPPNGEPVDPVAGKEQPKPGSKAGGQPDGQAKDGDAAATPEGAAGSAAVKERPLAIGEVLPPRLSLTPVNAQAKDPKTAPGKPAGGTTKPVIQGSVPSGSVTVVPTKGTEKPAAPVRVSILSLTRGPGLPPPSEDAEADATAGVGKSAQPPTDTVPSAGDAAKPTPAAPKRKPIVLLFWSRDCPVARRYVSPYAALAQDFGASVSFQFVVANHGESPAAARQALADAGVTLPVFSDPGREVVRRLGVRVTPTALVFDRMGVLRYRGPVDDDRKAKIREPAQHLRLALVALLAGKPIEGAEPRPFGCAVRRAP